MHAESKKKKLMFMKQCKEIEELEKKHKSKERHEKIKLLTTKKETKSRHRALCKKKASFSLSKKK